MSADLDYFIREHKAKLAKDRHLIESPAPGRRQWQKQPDPSAMPLHEDRAQTPADGGNLRLSGFDREARRTQERRQLKPSPASIAQHKNQGPPNHRRQKENIPPSETPDEMVFLGQFGNYEEKRKQLQAERHKEYNDMLHKLRQRELEHRRVVSGRVRPEAPNRKPVPQQYRQPMREEQSQREPMRMEQQYENEADLNEQDVIESQFAPSKAAPRTVPSPAPSPAPRSEPVHPPAMPMRRGPAAPAPEEFSASLPGLTDRTSAELSKMKQRNQEYNDFLRQRDVGKRQREEDIPDPRGQGQARTGWQTPTYEEILEKKRREEKNYRRSDDLGLYDAPRTNRNDSHLRDIQDDLDRLKRMDREYEVKKVQFANEVRSEHSLLRPLHSDDPITAHMSGGPPPRNDFTGRRPPVPQHPRALPATDTYATLGVGYEVSASADTRKKATYAEELRRQMEEQKQTKKMEKVNRHAASEGINSFPGAGNQPVTRQRPQGPSYQPTGARNPEDFSPRRVLFTDEYAKFGQRPPSLGLEGLYHSTVAGYSGPTAFERYFTERPGDSSRAVLDLYNTPPDDAYSYYGRVDPLTQLQDGPGASLQGRDYPPPAQQTGRFNRRQATERERPPAQINAFPSDDDRKMEEAEKKKRYHEEIRRQIEEDKRKKQQQKEEKDRYEAKLDAEIRNYNPFGRGGGGAPLRDNQGNLVSDLKQMHGDNERVLVDPQSKNVTVQSTTPAPFTTPRNPATHRSEGPNDEPSHARGGHGIFGEPKTDQQKTQDEKYKEALRLQIEERKRLKEIEQQKEKAEEAKIARKIEEDLKRIQDDFDRERLKDQEKRDAERRKQEEMARLQEEAKKRDDDDKKRERERAAKQRDEEQRREQDENNRRNVPSSPPIPALRNKHSTESEPLRQTDSPPVPVLRHRSQSHQDQNGHQSPPAKRAESRTNSRPPSGAVLQQLTNLKRQLQKEQEQMDREFQRGVEPEVYDPRVYRPASQSRNVDVFDVREDYRRSDRPAGTPADARNIEDFRRLKKGGTQSRQNIHKLFPDTPTTGDALETQQRALLDAQEEQLRRLHPDRGGKDARGRPIGSLNPRSLGLNREDTVASAVALDHETAYIDIPENGYPNDFDNLPKHRNDSARHRRRNRLDSIDDSPSIGPSSLRGYDSTLGSQTSLDPDSIARRNDNRLKRLKALTGDEISTGDPDDILANFLSKQQHQRPPSGRTLQDETWLRAD